MTTITGVLDAGRQHEGASRDPVRNRQRVHVALHITLIAWAAISIFPAFYMVLASFQTTQQIYQGVQLLPQHATFSNYLQAWEEASFGRYFANSVFYTTTVTAMVLVLGTAGAYAFARLRFFGKSVIFYVVLAFLFIPIPGQFIPLYVILVRLHLANTSIGYILPLINANLPATIFILRRFFEAIPREIDAAAQLDGAGRLAALFRVNLQLVWPGLVTAIVFTFVAAWNEFAASLVILSTAGNQPLSVALTKFVGQYETSWQYVFGISIVAIVPVVVLFMLIEKRLVGGLATGGVK